MALESCFSIIRIRLIEYDLSRQNSRRQGNVRGLLMLLIILYKSLTKKVKSELDGSI